MKNQDKTNLVTLSLWFYRTTLCTKLDLYGTFTYEKNNLYNEGDDPAYKEEFSPDTSCLTS